jgi:hypothetical protein
MGHNRAPLSPSCMDCGCPYSLFRDFPTCADYTKEANDE